VYGPVPPEGVTVAVPFDPPKQAEVVLQLAVGNAFTVTNSVTPPVIFEHGEVPTLLTQKVVLAESASVV
jgi:hypothetical protein